MSRAHARIPYAEDPIICLERAEGKEEKADHHVYVVGEWTAKKAYGNVNVVDENPKNKLHTV